MLQYVNNNLTKYVVAEELTAGQLNSNVCSQTLHSTRGQANSSTDT